MARKYDRLVNMTKDPMNALKAVSEPTYMQPRTVQVTPHARMALKGFLNLGDTWANCPLNGVAPSRASVHRTRLAVR